MRAALLPPRSGLRAAATAVSRVAAAGALALLLGGCAGDSARRAAPTLGADRIAEIVASPDRSAADRTNDIRRKPVEMLAFIGVRLGMTALDLSAGGGYTTELLARAVGPAGKVYGQSAPRDATRAGPAAPEGAAAPAVAPTVAAAPIATAGATAAPAAMAAAPSSAPAASGGASAADAPRPATPRTSAMALAERARKPAASNIVAVQRRFEDPVPAELAANGLDLVTLMFNYHDLGHMGVDRARMNAAVFRALKPGGLYVIADHAGRPGTRISESGTLHRVEESFLRAEVEAAGFRLADEGRFLRNPNDPRDMNTPNPPQPKDEFVLKFVKP